DGSGDACGNYQIDIVPCAPRPCVCDAECDDGQFCNGDERCVNDVCLAGTPPDCDDGDPFTDDFCDEGADTCGNELFPGFCYVDADCNDGNACTDEICDRPDVCAAGLCTNPPLPPGAPCGDQTDTPCNHADTCDGAGACQDNLEQDDTPCDDGLFCTVGETCTGGDCGGGTPRNCDDGNPCTTDECDDADDTCVNTLDEEGCCVTSQECDDDNECTDNVCGPLNTCEFPPSNGDPCGSQSDTLCTAPDTCDQTGTCQPNDINEGGPCDDGDACTDPDACVLGLCTGTPSGVCETCAQLGPGNDPTNQLSFQAFLKGPDQQPLQGAVDLTFQFYADENGFGPVGNPIPITSSGMDGVVSTTIPITETIFDGSGRWLGVVVNGGPELAPLIPVNSSAQAFRTSCVSSGETTDNFDWGDASHFGRLSVMGPRAGQEGDPVRYAVLRVIPTGDSAGGGAAGRAAPPSDGQCGELELAVSSGAAGTAETVTVDLRACEPSTGIGGGGELILSKSNGTPTIELDADSTGRGGRIDVRNDSGQNTIILEGDRGESGQIRVRTANDQDAVVIHARHGVTGTLAGYIEINDSNGEERIILEAQHSNYGAAKILVKNRQGFDAVRIEAAHDGGRHDGGRILLHDRDGDVRVLLEADHVAKGGTKAGLLRVWNSDGSSNVSIFGDYNNTGDSRIVTDELQIRGGSDLSEQFDIDGPTGTVKPGAVVSIDPKQPGKLLVSSKAYDRRVAGIISGAGGVKPGMLMGQAGSVADGDHPVALSGRVYCWADASNGPIQPGDLLTASDTLGHAMKVTDYYRAHGA
ncbi:MAG: hypothetical protein IH987_08915, partial [Planctomycetes bacterium]|nr:hypothetical protein [Planctomycetota bacterium]